jgi:hypothetical protein
MASSPIAKPTKLAPENNFVAFRISVAFPLVYQRLRQMRYRQIMLAGAERQSIGFTLMCFTQSGS